MWTRLFVIFLFSFLTNTLFAQNTELIAQGSSPDIYIIHTVAAKENWYSIGRLYNTSPKEIAPYNGSGLDKPLNIGQELKIPLHKANFTQNGTKAADEVFLPVYHIIQEKEWMYRISVNFNKVPVETLEKWNGITNDQAKAGMKLIVGYLRVKKGQSALASAGSATMQHSTAVTTVQPQQKMEATKMEDTEASNRKTEDTRTVAKQEKEIKEQLPQEIKEEKSASTPVKPAEERKQPPATDKTVAISSSMKGDGGYFKSLYQESGKSALGFAGVFKSNSGWQDSKYYALMNNVPVGTIIKVSNSSNSRTVFAKVLGQLPDMKESIGLTIRISDAAAAELAASESKFNVGIKY